MFKTEWLIDKPLSKNNKFSSLSSYEAGLELYFRLISVREKCDAAFKALHTKATRIFQHIYLMYANDLAVLNEGTINHYNDGLFQPG